MIKFRRRCVKFGAHFETARGIRTEVKCENATQLFENEVVVDLGGSCYEEDGEDRLILDHHFAASNSSSPSASAAVLCHAPGLYNAIIERVPPDSSGARQVWIVTHELPDFDALCAAFLVECILEQESEFALPLDNWERLGLTTTPNAKRGLSGSRIKPLDWFNPPVSAPSEYCWPLLLAAYACRVDHCLPIRCRRDEAFHSVLYAAIVRRGKGFAQNGARELFSEAVTNIRDRHLNPIYDALFANTAEFQPELSLLRNELAAYRRDLARARKCVVQVQRSSQKLGPVLRQIEDTPPDIHGPLLTHPGRPGTAKINAHHLQPFLGGASSSSGEVKGLFLRDPECLLFKEWARDTQDDSDDPQGFVFTAIAYSDGRPDAPINRADYIFSLDPTKIPGAHLYNLWMRLQCEEVNARSKQNRFQDNLEPREGFRNRSRGFEAEFSDPWFDGSNYDGKIVATPRTGTFIGAPGKLADLSDDPIAQIVTKELEYSLFKRSSPNSDPVVFVQDFALHHANQLPYGHRIHEISLDEAISAQMDSDRFRYAAVPLVEHCDLGGRQIITQLGLTLWKILSPPTATSVPEDFERKHLTTFGGGLAIWNRYGIAIADKTPDAPHQKSLLTLLARLSKIASDVQALIDDNNQADNDSLTTGEELLRKVVELKVAAGKPEHRPLRHLMNAIHFDAIVESVHALNAQFISRKEAARSNMLNVIIGLFALTFALPTLLLTFFSVVHGPSERAIAVISIAPFVLGVAAAIRLYLVYRNP